MNRFFRVFLAAGSGLGILFLCLESEVEAADPAPLYLRVTVEDVEPAGPVLVGVSVFRAYHETLAKFSPSRDGRRKDFSVGWHDSLPWQELGAEHELTAGQRTGWIEITDVMAIRPKDERIDDPNRPVDVTELLHIQPPLKTFALGFHSPSREARVAPGWYKADGGNVDCVTALIEFADRPDEVGIRKQVRYESQSSVIAVVVPDSATPLAGWADGIRSMHDYATSRLTAVQRQGITQQPLPQRLLISGSAMSGFFFPLYDRRTAEVEAQLLRLLGIREVPGVLAPGYSPEDTGASSLWLWQLNRQPQDVGLKPWAGDDVSAAVEALLPAYQSWCTQSGYRGTGQLVVKAGDEPGLLPIESLQTPEGTAAFQEWLRQRGAKPGDFAAETWPEILPVAREQATTPALAGLHYQTVWFQQESTAQLWSRFRQAIRRTCEQDEGNQQAASIVVGTDAYYGGFSHTPDYFIESRLGVMDWQMHHYGFGWGAHFHVPETENFFIGDWLRSAAKLGNTRPGILWFPCRIKDQRGIELSGMSALIRGMRQFHLYGFGPKSSQWEWFSDDRQSPGASAAVARTLQTAARIEDFLFDGRQPEPEVAVLHCRGTEIWENVNEIGRAGGWATEKRMVHAVLARHQVPVDLIPEEEAAARLDAYKLLYITDPHLSREAAKAIAAWIQRGGVLFCTAGAAMRDEANQASDHLAMLTEGALTATESNVDVPEEYAEWDSVWAGLRGVKLLDTATWQDGGFPLPVMARREQLTISRGRPLARYGDDSIAAAQVPVGRGSVFRVGTSLAAALASTADPPWRDGTFQRTWDQRLAGVYLFPLALAQVSRPLRISQSGVDATWYETADAACILLADYASPARERVEVQAKFSRDFRYAETLDGQPLRTDRDGPYVRIRDVPLETTQVILCRP